MDAYGITDTITQKGNNLRIKQIEQKIQDNLKEIEALNQLLDASEKKYQQKEKQLESAQTVLDKIQQ